MVNGKGWTVWHLDDRWWQLKPFLCSPQNSLWFHDPIFRMAASTNQPPPSQGLHILYFHLSLGSPTLGVQSRGSTHLWKKWKWKVTLWMEVTTPLGSKQLGWNYTGVPSRESSIAIVFHERAIFFLIHLRVIPSNKSGNNRISTCSATHFGYEVRIQREDMRKGNSRFFPTRHF